MRHVSCGILSLTLMWGEAMVREEDARAKAVEDAKLKAVEDAT